MSYNGVGLSTVRGSGTNGYVQKNFASVRKRRKQPRYDEQKSRAALESRLHRPPNKELLEHDRKREIELKCAEMEDKMEEQGYPEDEIEEQISVLRATLLEQYNKDLAKRNASNSTHAKAQRRDEKNARAANAFGIEQDYKPGQAFDQELQAQRKEERIAKRDEERRAWEERKRERETGRGRGGRSDDR